MANVRTPQHRKRHDPFTSSSFLSLTHPFTPVTPQSSSSLFPTDRSASPKQAKGFGHSFQRMTVQHPDLGTSEQNEPEHVASRETTNSSTSPMISDREATAEQDQPMQTTRTSASPTTSSASPLQRISTTTGDSDTPTPPVNRRTDIKRSGWSLERMAITHNDPSPAHRYATGKSKTQEPSSQGEVLQQKPIEPAAQRENITGLPDHLKTGIESLSGLSLDDVHVHYNSSKPAQVDALAYTQGSEIHVGPGQEQHLAHEAWHVVQQKQGRVEPTLQTKGVTINDDEGLEREADHMGMLMLLPHTEPPRQVQQVHTGSPIVQGMFGPRRVVTASSTEDTTKRLSQEIVSSVNEKLSTLQGGAGEDHYLLIRFFTTKEQMNSKTYQTKIAVDPQPPKEELLNMAVGHMYMGETQSSPFISFTEDIAAFMNSLDGPDVSWSVRSIVRGSNPQFYGKKGMERISQPPARYIGIFKVKKDTAVRWEEVIEPAKRQKQTDPAKTADLKMNFIPEREVVAYSPEEIDGPIETIENPFYQWYMDQVPEEAKKVE